MEDEVFNKIVKQIKRGSKPSTLGYYITKNQFKIILFECMKHVLKLCSSNFVYNWVEYIHLWRIRLKCKDNSIEGLFNNYNLSPLRELSEKE
jgi:hypothetical protein